MRIPSLALVTLGLAFAAPAAADASLVTKASAGQQALAIGVSPAGVVAHVCAREAGCTSEGGTSLDIPAEAKPLLGRAKADAITLADGKQVARVAAEGADGASWVMLVAAPLAGKGDAPLVLFQGFSGAAKGDTGEERASAVVVEPLAKGARILVGQRREDVTICGRPTIVSARELDPASLTWMRGASVQNLSAADRAAATKITATPVPADRPPPSPLLLRAKVASSAVDKAYATITDGDPETTWSEAKAGEGRGEFVVLSSASEVPITALEIVVRPAKADVPEGAAPRTFYLATEDRLFEVSMPEDAWKKGGGRYEIKLPAELSTSCLTVVLGDSFAPAGDAKARVTIAEIAARTAFDGASPEALVGALAGGGERAKAAAALLGRGGGNALRAVVEGYGKLDEAGQRLAQEIIDAASCGEQAPFYARLIGEAPVKKQRLRIEDDPALVHARDRLRRCGRASAKALAELVEKGSDAVKVVAASEISLLAPSDAVPVLTAALESPSDDTRRELRAALAHAARGERAKDALAEELLPEKFRARSEVVQIDLLRALGAGIGNVPGAREAFFGLAVPEAGFRTRYLLQGPAAELTRAGDERAKGFALASLRKDPDPHVRLHAAEVAARAPALLPALVEAVDDAEPRVRDAAIQALGAAAQEGTAPPASLGAVLGRRLALDPWTFVRAHAAHTMGALPASAPIDDALAKALGDASPEVRGQVLDALGAHKASRYASRIRAVSEDADEVAEVRSRAILALAAMCDTSSLDAWTKLAQGAAQAFSDDERTLGAAAIAALGDVHPKDLQKRLAPLLGKDVPRNVREMARAALTTRPLCSK